MVLQNKAVRVIAGVPPRSLADNLYLELDILPVQKIFVYAISIFMYKYMNAMLPELFLDMFTPISNIHSYDTRQAKNKKNICFLQINFWRPTIYYIYWIPCMKFYLFQNQSYLLHRIIQKTCSSIITALFCVGFDVVITDIKTNTFFWPWPPCEYIYTYRYTCFACIYMYMYVC